MNDPDTYARRVRERPYGPVEVTAGPVTVWFHGPHVVVALVGDDGRSLTLTGAGDDGRLAVGLAEFFEAASGGGGEFADASRLVVEQPSGSRSSTSVTRWYAQDHHDGCRMVLAAAVTITLRVDPADLVVHADATRAWAKAIGVDDGVPAVTRPASSSTS